MSKLSGVYCNPVTMEALSTLNSDWMPRVSVAIRGYYDRSGQKTDERITLAGYAAPISSWKLFERCWVSELQKNGCPYLHMVEARGLRDAFDKKKGWTTTKADALLRDLVNNCLIPHGRSAKEEGLFGAYCTIESKAYEQACRVLPDLEKKGRAGICAEYVTAAALRLLPQDPDKPEGHRVGVVELHFDRGEEFKGQIEKAWNDAKNRPVGRRGPLSMVSQVTAADMRVVPGLQAADYLAWHVNRWFTEPSTRANFLTVLPTAGVGNRFGYDKLIAWYRDGLDPLQLSPTPSAD